MAGAAVVIKHRPKGLAALFTVQNLRHLVQLSFVVFIANLAVQHAIVGEGGMTVVASPEAYCPFGDVETLYRFITSGGKTINHTQVSNVVVFVATLASVLVFRSAFCGWICPFGTLQEGITPLHSCIRADSWTNDRPSCVMTGSQANGH